MKIWHHLIASICYCHFVATQLERINNINNMRSMYLTSSSPQTSFTARIKNITCTIVVRPIEKGEVVTLMTTARVGDFHLFVSKLIVSQRRRCGVG